MVEKVVEVQDQPLCHLTKVYSVIPPQRYNIEIEKFGAFY
jgi:hypothetical protein